MLLNLDAGELDTETEALWSMFDLLACACGGHAGDDVSMAKVAAFCARSMPVRASRSGQSGDPHRVRLGAHPSYPDRAHFGRRSIVVDADALAQAVEEQCRALAQIARGHGLSVRYAKPHGALYHDAAREPAIAAAVLRGVIGALGDDDRTLTGKPSGDALTIIGPPTGALHDAALQHGLAYAREGFADRRMAGGALVPRTEHDALVTDPRKAAEQAVRLAREVDTICMHADTPNALEIARAVREALHGR
ncbi:MAG: LamB/YcsF family protein [Myxococcota bacterium]|nr:LamB/YcsF family protein [Myxococcota bacterium]